MRRYAVGLILGLFGLAMTAQAAEVSLISGIYQQESRKVEGSDAGGSSNIEFGTRYADEYDIGMTWFAQGMMNLRSYDAPSDSPSPSDSTSLSLGGGLRMYFDAWAPNIAPFLFGTLSYMNDKTVAWTGVGYDETEENGLFYGMHTGLRFGYDQLFFIDVEMPLFVSALNATTTVDRVSSENGEETSQKTETTRTELFGDTVGSFNEIQIVLGMKI